MKGIHFILLITCLLTLTSCLPGESDVEKRYRVIMQRAAVESGGLALAQAAQNYTTYRVALKTVRKGPLGDTSLSKLGTIAEEDNPEPKPPAGVQVDPCGPFGAIAYFTAQPKGLPPLKTISSTMARALAGRFSGVSVGMQMPNGQRQMPEVTKKLTNCPITGAILPGSPIFASGFEYKEDDVLPDRKQVTWPGVDRDITVKCPSGYEGVIKREQKCTLKYDPLQPKKEKGEILVGGYLTPNPKMRDDKEWDCAAAGGGPTADEIATFCRDPAAGLTKPDDNPLQLDAENMRVLLEDDVAGTYSYKCRANSNGTSTCDVKDTAGSGNGNIPKDVSYRCEPVTGLKEQFVINPKLPIEIDAAGKVVSATPGAAYSGAILGGRECGRGWTGDLVAGYMTRRCDLYKKVGATETLLKSAQTVYRIGYVAARCKRNGKEDTAYCPRPYDGTLTVRKSVAMNRPLALQLRPAAPGVWSSSYIPWRRFIFGGNTSMETLARAMQEGYRIPRVNLEPLVNPEFSSELEAAMYPDIFYDVDGCKLTGQNCELPPDPINLGIVFDRSGSMTNGNLTSANNRMECAASLGDIFSDRQAACAILRDHALGRNQEGMGSDRETEETLVRYLIDAQNPVFRNMVLDAVQNTKLCDDRTIDQVGYCKPGGSGNQSSCMPGTCTPVGNSTGTKVVVADDQLQTALNYVPPGSNFRYIEYIDDNIYSGGTQTCNTVTDASCDYTKSLNDLRQMVGGNKGKAVGGTPLMEATQRLLDQFDATAPGVIIFFTDGEASDPFVGEGYDKSVYNYPYAGFCEEKAPERDTFADICRRAGIAENATDPVRVENALDDFYSASNCSTDPDKRVCVELETMYLHSRPPGTRLVGTAWMRCDSIRISNLPTAVDYLKANRPNLRILILNLGGSELDACRSKQVPLKMTLIDASEQGAFSSAFNLIFGDLDTKTASPEDVCQRIRNGTYPNATSY